MKRTTLQLRVWCLPDQTTEMLLLTMDGILEGARFSIAPEQEVANPRRRRGSLHVFSWDRVALEHERAWFTLVLGRYGPWLELSLRTRRRSSVGLMESLFQRVIERLAPIECLLVNSNADSLPLYAHGGKGGLSAHIDCDFDPPVETRPGDPEWFRRVGVERRFLAKDLLDSALVDPLELAAQDRRSCAAMAHGFVFDGGWDAHWHPRLTPEGEARRPGRDRLSYSDFKEKKLDTGHVGPTSSFNTSIAGDTKLAAFVGDLASCVNVSPSEP